jgi:lysozyme
MTTAFLAADIQSEEGRVYEACANYATGGAPWTIGIGHTGPEVHRGLTWTDRQVDEALNFDIQQCMVGLDCRLPWWTDLDDARQDVLVQLTFQLGLGGVLELRDALRLMRDGDYPAAAEALRTCRWARHPPGRMDRLADQMETGRRDS